MVWVLFGDEASKYTLINSVGDYYNTLGRRQFYCLFNSLFGLTTKKTPRKSVPVHLWGELMYYREIPLQRASNAQMLLWHDVIMRNNNIWKYFLYFIHWWPVYCFNEDYESSVWQLLSSLAAPWVVVTATCGEALISVTHCGPVTLHGNISAFFGTCYGCQWIPSYYLNHIKFNVFETTWKTFS